MKTPQQPTAPVDDFFDLGFDQDADSLAQWLENQYRRHKEDEDRQAGEMLRKLAQAQRDEPKRMLEAAKKQAKRLLKLAKATPETPDTLKITALHEAQEIVAKLHGYPHWKAMAGTIR